MKKLLLLLLFIYLGQVQGQIISTICGDGTPTFSGDGGPASSARIYNPIGIEIDNLGNIYIADFSNNRIRKIDASNIITTITGTGSYGFTGDGGQATFANLYDPRQVTVDNVGNYIICDASNRRVRKVNTLDIINTIAGIGTTSCTGDNGQANLAAIGYPSGIAFDKLGNLYVADWSNCNIRKINTFGIISRIAGGSGTSGFSGDGGQATLASLSGPEGIAVDIKGNIYIADAGNNCIRKIDTTGVIHTIAGNGIAGFSGDGGLATNAKLNNPQSVVLDKHGNLYIADAANNRIRTVNTSGMISTIVGNGTGGFSGDGGQSILAELNYPMDVAFDSLGNMYISDYNNHRIRKVTNVVTAIYQLTKEYKQVTVYPNPTSDQFFIDANTNDKLNVDLYDVNGRHMLSSCVMDKSNISLANLDNGIYTVTIKSVDHLITKKLVIVR